jgi:hypothetical protein
VAAAFPNASFPLHRPPLDVSPRALCIDAREM